MDLVIRNARPAGGSPVDIGIEHGRIAAIAPRLAAEGPSFDAQGRLACPGLIETHIHLDKSRIIDRCAPQERRTLSPILGVAPLKKTMSVEDVRARAARTLEECVLHGTTRMRTQVEVDPGIGMRGFEARRVAHRRLQVGDRHRDVRLSAGRADQLSRDRRAAGRGAKAGRKGHRRCAALRHRRPGADPSASSSSRASIDADIDLHLDVGQHARRHAHPPGARADREVQARRPGRGRPHGEALAAAAGRGRDNRAPARRQPASA